MFLHLSYSFRVYFQAREIAREGLPSDVKASFIQEENKSDDEFNSLVKLHSFRV